jgi:hypothetical protein
MIELKQLDHGKYLELHISGRITRDDYGHFLPEVERLIQEHGKIRILLDMHDFHGWTTGALWEDLKFDVRHFRDIERVAMLGESAWEKGMSAFCKPFTTAAIRYFDRDQPGQPEAARAWLQAN